MKTIAFILLFSANVFSANLREDGFTPVFVYDAIAQNEIHTQEPFVIPNTSGTASYIWSGIAQTVAGSASFMIGEFGDMEKPSVLKNQIRRIVVAIDSNYVAQKTIHIEKPLATPDRKTVTLIIKDGNQFVPDGIRIYAIIAGN